MSDAEIEITLEETDSKGRYVHRAENAEAEMTFSKVGTSRIIIDHTGVPDTLRILLQCAQGHAATVSRLRTAEQDEATPRSSHRDLVALRSYVEEPHIGPKPVASPLGGRFDCVAQLSG